MRTTMLFAVLSAAALGGALDPGRADEPAPCLAVVVHPKNPTADLPIDALIRIARGEVRTWPHGERVVLILPPAGSPARRLLLERVLRMTERELKRHFIERLYGGDLPDYPITARSAEGVLRSVASVEPAVGFVLVAEADATVKVISVGGLRPADDGYPLAATAK